jgi:hypothetical protein
MESHHSDLTGGQASQENQPDQTRATEVAKGSKTGPAWLSSYWSKAGLKWECNRWIAGCGLCPWNAEPVNNCERTRVRNWRAIVSSRGGGLIATPVGSFGRGTWRG